MLIRAALLALVIALFAPPAANATGVFDVQGTTVVFSAQTGFSDQIAAFDAGDFIRFTRFGGDFIGPGAGCVYVSGDSNTVDCKKAGVSTLILNLGDQDDVAVVSPALKLTTVFNGGPGNDGLFGGGGIDFFDGGPGNDNVISRDGQAEPQVNCGDGADTAISDDGDTRISCEEVEGDADLDGVRAPRDCNDANAAIRPGVTDVPENGIDENCDGVDATNADRDGDGVPRPQDCDDTSRAIRPGATEVIGNAVDENCDGLVAPFPPLTGSVSGTWQKVGSRTRNLTLVAKGFPFRTQITLRCTGSPSCPKTVKRTIGRAGRSVNLHAVLGRRALPKKARLTVSITRASRIGRELRYSLGTPGLPEMDFLCRPPGGSAGPC